MKFQTKNNLGRVICTTQYQKEEGWIYCDWEGFANVDAVKAWGEEYLSLLKKTKCDSLLNDDSRSTGPWTQSLEWIESYLIPNVIQAGLKYYAHIVSANTFSEMSAKELNVKIANGALEMATFKSIEEAKDWLKSKQ